MRPLSLPLLRAGLALLAWGLAPPPLAQAAPGPPQGPGGDGAAVHPAQETPRPAGAAEMRPGRWRAWLDAPGGELPFLLDLAAGDDGALRAHVRNAEERIEVPRAFVRSGDGGPRLRLEFPHYDAHVTAALAADGTRLDGEYAKRLGSDRWRRMPFHAAFVGDPSSAAVRFPAGAADAVPLDASGRWRIDFSSSEDPAVGLFEQDDDGLVTGTILTTTGDYRYLAGRAEADRLRLSVFDGAHAFLFDARPDGAGGLHGNFWSGDSWHETWTAVRDDGIALPNAFAETRWQDLASLSDVLLPDASGELRALADPELRGKATLVVLFGSWCPNCHDEAPYLVELHERYGDRGLSVVGLAFEFTGDRRRDSEQLRRFAERHGVEYPLLLAGTADKADATLAFPGVDYVRSYPTTLFVDEAGRVRWVHSGFSGPATGAAHERLREEFEARIERLLDEPAAGHGELERALVASPWRSDERGGGRTVLFRSGREGELIAHVIDPASGDARDTRVRLVGHDAVWVGERLYRLDPVAQVLASPTEFGARLMPDRAMDSPLLAEMGYLGIHAVPEALLHDDPRVRREAVWSLGRRRQHAASAPVDDLLPLAADPEVEVAIAAAWAVGATGNLAAAETLAALKGHPNARMRREVTRGLARFARMDKRWADELATLREDPDPLVRSLAGGE